MAAFMQVTAKALEHMLDFPEGIEIVDIVLEHGHPDTVFRFCLVGIDPATSDPLQGTVMATYSQTDEGVVSFEGFHQLG